MTDKRTQDAADGSNMEKDPNDWVTGDEPMTGAQRSYLKTLSEQAKAPFDDTLTKAQASQRIDELQQLTGRGASSGHQTVSTTESEAGEEDPGASVSQNASSSEARSTVAAGSDGAAHEQAERTRAARENVTEGYGGSDPDTPSGSDPDDRKSGTTSTKPHHGTGSDPT